MSCTALCNESSAGTRCLTVGDAILDFDISKVIATLLREPWMSCVLIFVAIGVTGSHLSRDLTHRAVLMFHSALTGLVTIATHLWLGFESWVP